MEIIADAPGAEETIIVIMQKDRATGFLEKELLSCKVSEHENLIVNVYAEEEAAEEAKSLLVHMKITTEREVSDWEFDAVYDYYDDERIKSAVSSIAEVEDCYNPTWETVFPFSDNAEQMGQKISQILSLHMTELLDVYEAIKDKEAEYR